MLTLSLGLGACGDDKGDVTTTNTPTTTPPDTTSASSEATDPGTTDPTGATTQGPTTNTPTTTGEVPTTGTPVDTDTDAGTTTGATTDVGTTTDANTTGDDTTGSNTTGEAEDSKWPKPDANAECPEGFVPAQFVMGGLVCSPACAGPGKICPSGDTGNAMPACVFNPDSSGTPCMEGEMCEDDAEMCVQTGGGGMACLAPSSHCVLLCQGLMCPDGMECSGDLVCQYPV